MADDFKTTVSRTITTDNRQFSNLIWQAGKPPLDSELNLVGQIATDNLAKVVSTNAHSGILLDPRSSMRDFTFNPLWSNFLKVKGFKALVNGLVVNVAESQINLPPPPASDFRVDFVFLEVWKGVLSAEGSGGDLTNKPTNTTVYENGNIAGSGLEDQMVDSNVGFETTKRVQVQYRFRVVSGVDLKSQIEGMSSPLVFARGPLAGVSARTFSNQYSNGDAGLWVATMTSDGLPLDPPNNTALSVLLSENVVYGIPVCSISRRNKNAYVAFAGAGIANQNGAFNRKPSAVDSTDTVTLTQATLTSILPSSTIGNVELTNGNGSGLDDGGDFYANNRYLVIGEGINREVIEVDGYASPNINIVARGVAGTQAKYHSVGTNVVLFNNRPDEKYSDQVHQSDLLDMRHATTLGEWDYQSLLESSLSDLLFGSLRSTYKQNQKNNTTAGTVVEEVSILNDSANPSQVFEMDLPNGFRDTWSDGAIPQMGITLYLKPEAINPNGITTTNINNFNISNWEVAPDLQPSAFLFDTATPTLKSGSWIKLSLNLTNTNLGYGVNNSKSPSSLTEAGIRFIAPKEVRNPSTKRPPFTIEEVGVYHKPLLYPTTETNFERPFIVLGKAKHSASFTTSITQNPGTDNFYRLYRPTAYNSSKVISTALGATSEDQDTVIAVRLGASADETPITTIIALESLVTNNGYDTSGDQSSLYAVLYGDPDNQQNNGVFKVIDILNNDTDTTAAGYANYYTDKVKTAWNPTSKVGFLILKPIDDISRVGALVSGKTLSIEFRTQDITDQDEEVMIAITESTLPVGSNPITTLGKLHTTGEFQLGLSVLYPPTTGGIANVADNIHKIGITPPTPGELLSVSNSVKHGAGFANLPLVDGEIDLPTKNHVSLWNRLPSANLPIGVASSTNMGGRIINEEADRESEAFTDEKSKTLVLRPYQKKTIILNKATKANLGLNGVSTPLVPEEWNYLVATNVDPAPQMFLDTRDSAYLLPEVAMPRFGRQDIPLHTRTGNSDQFYNGLNHLFIDDPTATSDNIFNVVGGLSNSGNSPSVNPIFFVTGTGAGGYGKRFAQVDINSLIGTGARKTTLSVPTSDFGSTTKGIELPPYYGIVRVYGVYERGLFNTQLAQGDSLGGHQVDRITPKVKVTDGSCPNLLRTDTSSFTLYIKQGGGNDITSVSYQNAHTYVLTEHAIDISRIPTYVAGNTFDDFNYVIEATVFMFADGFISHNRYVLPREYNGSAAQQNETSPSKLVLDSVIPFAPPLASAITVAYSRTPYQGDPLNTLVAGVDQVVPQGRKTLNDLTLGTKVQPVDLSSTNKRNLEVLASMDFYTTLGTGKMGGEVYPTTITDVGHTPFPTDRNPTSLLADGLSHISLRTSTFNEEYSQKGGWASLFLFEQAEAIYKALVTINVTKNGSSLLSHQIGNNELTNSVPNLLIALQDKGLNSFQIRGEIKQLNTDNQKYYGILIQAPNPSDTFEIEVKWKDLRNGQDIQVFEGLREAPMSFEMHGFSSNINYEYKLNNRSQSKVPFSKISVAPLNAGNGNTPISLVGMTSRLPIGSLVRDSDFLCEDILNNQSSYLFSSTGSFSTISNPVPVNPNGLPYTQTLGISGDLLQMNDGKIFNASSPASQTKYTITRGGGSVFGVGGDVAGGPLSFLATSFGSSEQPVLKGSVLVGRAMLVRNFYETDDASNPKSYGDELQLVVATHTVDGGSKAITLGGDTSPSGYGEGFSASDRFRIAGKPLAKVYGQNSETNVTPAPYNS
jgi:hypothetical protein